MPALNRKIVDLFEREGAEAWHTHRRCGPAAQGRGVRPLRRQGLPQGDRHSRCLVRLRDELVCGVRVRPRAEARPIPLFQKGEGRAPECLYLEGGDQHRGWFHSSLLTSVALRGRAPYSHVATAGWTLDEQGRAMSKSLGNGVDPVDIANRMGGEIVRLWVASVDFREDMAASENLMQRCAELYRKAAQHLPLPARQSERLRSGARPRCGGGAAAAGPLHAGAHARPDREDSRLVCEASSSIASTRR